MRQRVRVSCFALLLPVAAAVAQRAEAPKKEWPAGWKLRLDKPGEHAHDSGVAFSNMPPGWHITTGPACILYGPKQTASGRYRIQAETFLFDPGQRREGYGVFFGGENLESEGQSYFYFLLRRDGRFLIKRRDGAATTVLVDWTAHSAIVPFDASTKTTAKNVLAIEAGAEAVDFFVNGQKVTSLLRAQVRTDGVVGLRINHSVNVHVSELSVTHQDPG